MKFNNIIKYYSIAIPFLMILVSCQFFNKPKNIDYTKNRTFDNQIVRSTFIEKVDFSSFAMRSADAKIIDKTKFEDYFFQKTNGDIDRYFYQTKAQVFYFTYQPKEVKKLEIAAEFIHGLIIGQAKNNIYYGNASARNSIFYRCNIVTNKVDELEIPDFTVISVQESPIDQEHLLLCGVLGTEQNRKLGFYHYNDKTKEIKTIYQLQLKQLPDGDPDIFAGTFYNFGKNIFYIFDNRSEIFYFNEQFNYLKSFTTPDEFNFKTETEETYHPKNNYFYNSLFSKDQQLYVLLNMVNLKEKLFYLDQYNISSGKYEKTIKVAVDFDPNIFSNANIKSQATHDGALFILTAINNMAENAVYRVNLP